MPYRFIFLGVDRVLVAVIIMTIKFFYKTTYGIVIFTPMFIKLKAF
jgi:hypothetical protein